MLPALREVRVKNPLQLFVVKIAVTHHFVADLVVAAESGGDALEYVKSTTEWHADGSFERLASEGAKFEPVSAKQVRGVDSLPEGFKSETLVWHHGCDLGNGYDVGGVLRGAESLRLPREGGQA